MKKDYSRHHFTELHSKRYRWFWGVMLSISVLLLSFILYFSFFFPQQRAIFSVYYAHFSTWLAERKYHLHRQIIKTKLLVNNKNEEDAPVHFEFYNTLPAMQVAGPQVIPAKTNVEETTIKKFSNGMTSKIVISNENDLVKELSEKIKAETYIIQLAVFKNLSSANRYHESLIADGLPADIVRLALANKTFYRVQLGPFQNKTKAQLIQRQLLRKGVSGVVRKI